MKKIFTSILCSAALLCSVTAYSLPKLNSYPGATAVIFLDFDGHTVVNSMWNGGTPIFCAGSGMTDLQITEAFNRAAEDYRAFSVNLTTDSTVFLAAPVDHRVRIIITPTSAWYPGVGGISYVGSFVWGDDTPGFVFCDRLGPNSPKLVGECCAHESGHTVGLAHQSRYSPTDCTNPTETYNSGVSTSTQEVSWAPIMGNSYTNNMTNWNNGPTPYGCNASQDNLSIITTGGSGFPYRPDDYPETLNASTYSLGTSSFNVNGIITTNTDKDAFKVTLTQNSNFHFVANPYSVGAGDAGADLDIKIEVFNSAAVLIKTYDPQETMNVTIDTILNTGTYYFKVSGTGNPNVTSYSSIGSYTLTGSIGALPIHDVALTGNSDKGTHNLNWNIIADEPIKSIDVEVSQNGSDFSRLTTVTPTANRFSYQPYLSNTLYYRLKVTSVLFQMVYSNTIALKGVTNTTDLFNVSTLVQSEISVNASEDYQYQLADMNGRVISKGTGTRGINKINIANQPGGLYIIQLFANNAKQTTKLVKQ